MYLSLLNKDIEINTTSEKNAKHHIQREIDNSKSELDTDEKNNILRKTDRNDIFIKMDAERKTALHNDYSKMMNSVGISISDITNHIVKTELQAIVDMDLEAQYNQVIKKEALIAKEKFSCELQLKQKEMQSKIQEKSSSMLLSSRLTSLTDIDDDDKTDGISEGRSHDNTSLQNIDETTTTNDTPITSSTWRNIFNL